jgi:hypothetical protein
MDWSTRVPFQAVDYGDFKEYAKREGPQRMEDENEWDHGERVLAWSEGKKEHFIVQPNPEPFSREDREDIEEKVDLRKDFGENGLQVIVKLANIHLTPEKPEYNGGTWHVEGQLVRE